MKVASITLPNLISINGNQIRRAAIEIDHINYGLSPSTKELNQKKRTNFSVKDIVKFLERLDGEFIVPSSTIGSVSTFRARIDCPIAGRFFEKEFIIVFSLDDKSRDEVYTITLFPGW